MSSEKQAMNPTAPVMTPPDDTPSFAGNYGLDGYNFYDDYGEGVKDSQRLPATKGRSGLPDGMIDPSGSSYDANLIEATFTQGDSVFTESELGQAPGHNNLGDVGDLMRTANTVPGPVDFAWLEGEQDPERLPEQPVDQALKGIQKSWGQRTDGQTFHHVPAKDHHPQFQDALVDFGQKQAMELAQMAMRLSAAGEDFKSIVAKVNAHIAGNPKAVEMMTPIMDRIASEHKLAGRVFIRAAAYPGCHDRKWKDVLTKNASAKYVVEAPKCGSCIHNQNGRCASLKKELVETVPWTTIREELTPKFAAVGVKLAHTENPRRDLKRAFAQRVAKERRLSDDRPTHTPVTAASESEAMEALASVDARPIVLKDNSEERKLASRKAEIQNLAKLGYFNSSQLAELMGENCPETLATKAASMVQSKVSTQREYQGAVFDTHQSEAREAKVTPREVSHVLRWATQEMNRGLCGKDLDNALQSQFGEHVLSASEDKLKLIRKAHEGLAGHAYVHAAAYVKGNRNEGCATGAKKVASRGLRHVLAMDRCAGCTKNTGGSCGVYRGKLVSSAPVKNVKAYQREKIASGGHKVSLNVYGSRVASTDESVYSLDGNPVDEYGLGGSSLDNIEYNPESKEESLADTDFNLRGQVL